MIDGGGDRCSFGREGDGGRDMRYGYEIWIWIWGMDMRYGYEAWIWSMEMEGAMWEEVEGEYMDGRDGWGLIAQIDKRAKRHGCVLVPLVVVGTWLVAGTAGVRQVLHPYVCMYLRLSLGDTFSPAA